MRTRRFIVVYFEMSEEEKERGKKKMSTIYISLTREQEIALCALRKRKRYVVRLHAYNLILALSREKKLK